MYVATNDQILGYNKAVESALLREKFQYMKENNLTRTPPLKKIKNDDEYNSTGIIIY